MIEKLKKGQIFLFGGEIKKVISVNDKDIGEGITVDTLNPHTRRWFLDEHRVILSMGEMVGRLAQTHVKMLWRGSARIPFLNRRLNG